jgi:hypothetical protein
MRGPGLSAVYGAGTSAAVGDNVPVPNGGTGNGIRAGSGTGFTPVPITTVFGNLYGSVLGQPLTWLFGLIGLLIAYKLIEEHRGGQAAFTEIKIGLNNVVKIGIAAVIFLVIFKFLLTRYQVPGLSSIAAAA